MGNAIEFERASHLEPEAVSDEHEGDVIEGVGIAFAEFVGPNDGGVVEQGA